MLNVLLLTSDLSSYCANAVPVLVATIVATVLALALATLGRASVEQQQQ